MPPTTGQREDWLAANFLELRKAEVQLLRIHLPRTTVNKGIKEGPQPRRARPFQHSPPSTAGLAPILRTRRWADRPRSYSV